MNALAPIPTSPDNHFWELPLGRLRLQAVLRDLCDLCVSKFLAVAESQPGRPKPTERLFPQTSRLVAKGADPPSRTPL